MKVNRTPAVRIASALFVLFAAACATTTVGPGWSGDGLHVVDGYWMLNELPCDLGSAESCVATIRNVEAQLGIDATNVLRAAVAAPPRSWVRSDGQVVTVLANSSGYPPEFVVLDLVDGSRRATGFGCAGVPLPGGSLLCLAFPLEQYQVGHSPIGEP